MTPANESCQHAVTTSTSEFLQCNVLPYNSTRKLYKVQSNSGLGIHVLVLNCHIIIIITFVTYFRKSSMTKLQICGTGSTESSSFFCASLCNNRTYCIWTVCENQIEKVTGSGKVVQMLLINFGSRAKNHL